jgi:1,4-dihydroxy-2-naphthoyl-CoA hydrolase
MPFSYSRTIHFADTDAAGVVFFARYYAICHEAYEEAIAAQGLRFGSLFESADTMIPISKSEAKYLRPLVCGDKLRVTVRAERLTPESFAIHYELFKEGHPEKLAAVARTEHVCISLKGRERLPLSPALEKALAAL